MIELLKARGTPAFGVHSSALYGSASDRLRGDRKSLRQLGEKLCEIFSLPAADHLGRPYERHIPAAKAVEILQARLGSYFQPGDVRVILSDGIVSDAAAGGDYIKINQDVDFTDIDLQVLEVHEGWVLMETLTFSSYPHRALKVSDRVVAVDMAEQGADFLEVYRFFTARGMGSEQAWKITQRVFRGGTLTGGSVFTKDLSYLRGFVENVNFMRSAIHSGVPEILPMLFVGKVTLDDIPILYQHYLEGTIAKPHYMPAMFRDLNGLYVWFGFASGISVINMARVQKHFHELFSGMPTVAPLYEKVIDSVVD